MCIIKIRVRLGESVGNVITLCKLIGLLLLFCPIPLYFVFENSKNTRIELARPVMGTIFFSSMSSIVYGKTIKKLYAKMRRRNYVVRTRHAQKSVLGVCNEVQIITSAWNS